MFTPAKIFTLLALSGAYLFGLLVSPQDPNQAVAPDRVYRVDATSPVAPAAPIASAAPPVVMGLARVQKPSEAAKAYRNWMKTYRNSAANSTEKGQARAKIAESLSVLYDENLALQEKQIDELAARLEKLREQIVKRRAAKARMVELKLEMVLSQADGLGWPDESNHGVNIDAADVMFPSLIRRDFLIDNESSADSVLPPMRDDEVFSTTR